MIKKIASLVIIILILLNSFTVYAADPLNIYYNEDTNCVEYDAMVTAATSGTRYRVLGFTVKLDGFSTTIKMEKGLDHDNGDGTKTVRFNIPVVGSGNSIMQRFIDKYGMRDEFVNFFSNDNTLYFDAIMTVTNMSGTTEIPLAEMSYNGTFTKPNGSSAVLGTDYFTTLSGIKYARSWKNRDDLDKFFNLQCFIPGKSNSIKIPDDLLAKPTAKISKGGTVITGTVTYAKNETISLSGVKSLFPNYAEVKYYKWEYKPVDSSSWVTIANGVDRINPTFPALDVGSYDVKLTVWYKIGSIEYTEMSDSTQVILDIVEYPEGAYVTVTPSCVPQIEVTQAQVDANVNIPVTVDATGFLNNFTDVSKISDWTLHLRKDPAGSDSQYQKFTFTSGLGLSQDSSKVFTVPASVLSSANQYTQKFAVKAEAVVNGITLSSNLEYCSVVLHKSGEAVSETPAGTIKFVPASCDWRNTDLPVRVYVDGNTTTTASGTDSRTYKYETQTCTKQSHVHSPSCYAPDGVTVTCVINEHIHTSSCYTTSSGTSTQSYTQNWSIDKIRVSGGAPLASSPVDISNNNTITLSTNGVASLSAKLTGWTAGTKSWATADAPSGSWDSTDTPTNTTAPSERYDSSSGVYKIDKVKPTITFDWSNQDQYKNNMHWYIYLPDNKINVTLGDNLSGVIDSRYAWTTSDVYPNYGAMNSLGLTTAEGAAGTIHTNINIHDTQDRVGKWYLHLYVQDRAGNVTRSTQPVYVECSLQNFRITDITDWQFEDVFWNPDYKTGVPTGNYYPVSSMPVDRHPTKKILPKIGYAFHFSMTSRGLNGLADKVVIKPRFYYLKDFTNASIINAYEVDLYYDMGKKYLVQYGSSRDDFVITYDGKSIGSTTMLELTNDVRTISDSKNATWFGCYGIIPTVKAVKKGVSITENGKVKNDVFLTKGCILVNFTIEGYKNGAKVFDYNPAQWTTEGGPKDSLFYTGDTIIFDLTYTSIDDYGVGTDR